MIPIIEQLDEKIKWKKVIDAIHKQIPNKLNFKVSDVVLDALMDNIRPVIFETKNELKNKL